VNDRKVPDSADVLAPDGSEVRILASASRGSMAHFKLNPGQVSLAVSHHTVEEIWYVLKGRGRIWRKHGSAENVTELSEGLSLTIPVGMNFQFRCDGNTALEIVGVTMPPWPGETEAFVVPGKW
jgi:mannose-6-phosphate isomerase-like protein (cupin superfamily)